MKIISLLLIFVIHSHIFTQVITFEKLFTTGQGYSVQQTIDGGYFVSGIKQNIHTVVIKTDPYGSILWTKIFDSTATTYQTSNAIQALDGGYIILGSKSISGTYNIYFIKTNINGDTLWTKLFGPGKYGCSVKQTTDGGFVILGISGGYVKQMHLIKTDSLGNFIWEKIFDIGTISISPNAFINVQQTIDGGFAIQNQKVFIKTDIDGNESWRKNFTKIFSFQQTTDSGYIFSGENIVTKTNQYGDDIWIKNIVGSAYSVKQTSDRGYIIVGTMGLLKIDQNGDSLWSRNLFGTGYSLQQTNDLGYIIAGEYSYKIWLLKTDETGGGYSSFISITSPAAGDVITAQSVKNIFWISNTVNYVRIEYSTNSGNNWNEIITNLTNTGIYNWSVPYVQSRYCKLKVSDFDDPTIYDVSEPFIITIFPYDYIAVNQILMWIGNDGSGSHDPLTHGNGFYWPGGINATTSAIFQDGLVWGGKIGSQIRFNGNTHRQGLQQGKILPDGSADDPYNSVSRIWKIKKGWENLPPGPVRDRLEYCYNNWPGEIGAPYIDVDGDGIFTRGIDAPKYFGDETLWYAANDLNSTKTTFTYGSLPIGLEFQTTVFGFDKANYLADVVFKKYKIINRSPNTIEDFYFGYWSDTDLGFAFDDYTGCDTITGLGYTYNADNDNEFGYGFAPPAVGYVFLQAPIIPWLPNDSALFDGRWIKGKKNLRMTAFALYSASSVYRDPQQGVYAGTLEFYNNLQGYVWNGSPFIDPHTGLVTKYCLAGDPVTGTGWYEGPGWPGGPWPSDRRHLMSTGPITMAPGDTQEVVMGIVIARGTSNINSITELRIKTNSVKSFYPSYIVTEVKDNNIIPTSYYLYQNYPNPFNSATNISYTLPEQSHVILKIYDVLGRDVATLVDEWQTAGNKIQKINGDNLASGVYYYKLVAKNFISIKKMLLIK